ncbi:MAG TPA: rhodanese-like domain-containing protein [Candidatus Brocadiia bacterium]|nr:rhodanese-like domain-containing protein [Candidatus Brocadiia bacterium]
MIRLRNIPAIVMLMLLCFLSVRTRAESIKDSESASHADAAAFCSLIQTYEGAGFRIMQYNLAVLSHYSYILVSGKDALVVDPARDIDAYIEAAKKEGLTIKGVLLTHSHADFVAGFMELAKAGDCPVYFNQAGGAAYPHEPIKDGAEIVVGSAVIRVIETPGHTPDGICGLVFEKGKADKPLFLFTGDTLFVGSIGRPDLMGGAMAAATLASMAFDTWTNKLSKLPDEVVILPAHGAGSLCGAHLSDDPSSTIGAQRTANPYLSHTGRNDFIIAVLDGLPEAPQYFKHNAAMNKKGPELVDWSAPLPPEPSAISDLADPTKHYVVDIRGAEDFAAGHIPNSVNIALRGRLETWVGIMVPWEANLVLCGDEKDLKEAAFRLHRVGYRAGAISFESVKKSGMRLSANKPVVPNDLYAQMSKGEAPVIVDVRLPSEWMGFRIGNVLNLPLNKLTELSSKLDPSQPIVTVCNSAYRSSMAIGILERNGFKQVSSLAGGSEAWKNAGLPVIHAVAPGGTASVGTTALRSVRLPERISAVELKRLLMDLPGTFEIVDIRPPAMFADYSIPGSRNADIADVMSNPAYAAGAIPLVLVDRDGTLAMAVAGILSQKTQRPIKALYGGLEAYWEESGASVGVPSGRVMPSAAPSSRVPSPAPVSPASPSAPSAPKPETSKKKSAGC